ncbi:MAG TPA: hydantoinase B/oxoprolinase family protein, partial [bacterium]
MMKPDVIQLELFTNRFRAIVQEMGEMLRRTAISTNVKERLDFSCALLDADGELVVNAPHLPVHLGAMGVCVRRIREVVKMDPGDVVITNHPAFGGSHLPDITVVTPVYFESKDLLG